MPQMIMPASAVMHVIHVTGSKGVKKTKSVILPKTGSLTLTLEPQMLER